MINLLQPSTPRLRLLPRHLGLCPSDVSCRRCRCRPLAPRQIKSIRITIPTGVHACRDLDVYIHVCPHHPPHRWLLPSDLHDPGSDHHDDLLRHPHNHATLLRLLQADARPLVLSHRNLHQLVCHPNPQSLFVFSSLLSIPM